MQILAAFSYLEQVQDVVSGAPGLVLFGAITGVALTVASVFLPKCRLALLTVAMYMSTLQRADATEWFSLTLSPFLQKLSEYSRFLTLGMLAGLAVAGVLGARNGRRTLLGPAVFAFFAFELLNCVKMATVGEIPRAVLSVITFMLILLAVPLGIGKTIDSPRKVEHVLYAILGVGALITLGTLHELVFNTGGVYNGKTPRLYATMGHPQKAGMMCALCIPIAAHLAIHGKTLRWAKPLLIGFAALLAIGVMATGSRTALLATFAGAVFLFRKKLHVGAVVAIFVAGITLFLFQKLSDSGLGDSAARLLSTENTREEAVSTMIQQFRNNPVFGAPLEGSGGRSSSVLGTPARLGLVGVAFLGAFTYLTGRLVWKLNRVRSQLGPDGVLVDVLLAGVLGMGVGCVFDQYVFDTLTMFNMFIYLNLAMGYAVLDIESNATARSGLAWNAYAQRAAPYGSGYPSMQ